MAFNAQYHASMARQQLIQLGKVNCETMRMGDRTRQGEQGPTLISSWAHMSPLNQNQALFVYN